MGHVAPPPQPPKKRRRRLLAIGLVAVLVVAAAAVGAFLVLGSSSEKFTFNGAKILEPAKVLSDAESTLRATVASRHGATANDTRCYFAKPSTPATGKPKTDVDPGLRCGPVLYVDGNAAKVWADFPLATLNPGDSGVTLTTGAAPVPNDPISLDAGLKLSRPDGKKPPKSTTLAVPQPPLADKKALIVSDLGPVTAPKQLDHARIGSLNVGLRLISAGIVPRYGAGDNARTAPPGEELIAFQIDSERGENGGDKGFSDFLKLKDSWGSRLVPTAPSDEYVIVAEPVGAKPELVVTDAGQTQTLSLPAGAAGADNLTVLSRNHRFTTTTQNVNVTLRAAGPGGSDSQTFHATAFGASLVYWPPLHDKDHPAHPGDAFLIMPLTYVDPSAPSTPFGFDSQLLSVRLPDGRTVQGQNIATDANHVLTVFEVPGTFTKGTVVIGGSEVVDGVTISVATPVNIAVSITAN